MDDYKKYEPIFGSWKIEKQIGKGSFGKVFEISREEYGTTYKAALKIISVPQDEDDIKDKMTAGTDKQAVSEYYEGILKEIISENELMAQLKGNSHIVSYEDHQIIPHEDGIGYDVLIRMELLKPLKNLMREKHLDEKEVVKLGADICKALEVCHRKNIIHRDIKPENIFVSENGDFKLGDFGIARTMEKTTQGMSKKGTYKFMAPEVYKGEDYGSTVDIYSLGIVLYTLLNGNRGPFLPAPPAKVTHNDEEEANMRRFRGEAIPAPRDAGTMLAYIIRKAGDPDPRKRYQTAEQMRGDLESYLANYGKPAAMQAPARAFEETANDAVSQPGGYAADQYAADQYVAGSGVPTAGMYNTGGGYVSGQYERVAEAHKKKPKIWIWAIVAVAVIAAGVAGFLIFGHNGDDETTTPEKFERQVDEEKAAANKMYDAYLDVLMEHEPGINEYTAQFGAPGTPVVISDISGDDTPELLFFEGQGASELRAFTYADGGAVEYTYDTSLLDGTINFNNGGLFTDAYAASGTSFMVYTGKEKGVFYIAYSIGDETAHCNSVRFRVNGTTITADKVLANDYSLTNEKSDLYYLNGTEVSMDEGAKELKADRKAFGRLLIYNGYNEDLKVFELTKDHQAEAMTYDEAIETCER